MEMAMVDGTHGLGLAPGDGGDASFSSSCVGHGGAGIRDET